MSWEMKRVQSLSAAIAAVLGGTATMGLVGSAFAADSEASQVVEEIVITGSRIVRRDLEAASPIVTVEEQAFLEKGTLAVETVLNELPQFVPANTQFVTGDVQPGPMSTPGSATLNLRGLGSNRTLVLVDGRRGQPANASLVVDINSIPSSAIQSVEIISGGASAVYGADAMGGVTNFKLKDNFEGLSFQTRAGVTEEGDGEEYSVNALLGAKLGTRGNALLGVEWQTRGRAVQNGRPFYEAARTDRTVFGPTESRVLRPSYEVVTSASSMGGVVTGNAPTCTVINSLLPGIPSCTTSNAPRIFYFNHDNSVFIPNYGGIDFKETVGDGHSYKIVESGGNQTLYELEHDPLLSSPMERYSMFGRAKYQVTDSITAFAQANFVSTDVFNDRNHPPSTYSSYAAAIPYGNQIYQPSRNQTTGATLPEYLAGGKFGLNCPATGGCTNSQAFPVPAELVTLLNSRGTDRTTNTAFAQPVYDAYGQAINVAGVNSPWRLSYASPYLPTRATNNTTQLYQVLAGMNGDLPFGDWTWEAYGSHGETHTSSAYEGYVSMALYRMVVQAPNYGRGFSSVDAQGKNIVGLGLGNKIATCTTGLPIFNEFTPSDDCIRAITIDATDRTDLSQDILEANFQGGLFELPAGELRAAFGLGYRKNDFTFTPDYSRDLQNVFDIPAGAGAAEKVSGATKVKELYGEMIVPVLRDLPLVQKLEFELGIRYSDYNTGAGSVLTHKELFSWTPADFIRIRGGYQRANRAPNVNELFLGASNIVAGAPLDPCAATGTTRPWGNVASNANRAQVQALCSALIDSPTSDFDADPNAFAGTSGGVVFDVQQGNANLLSERGQTYTIGTVLRSPFRVPALERMSLAIDYYWATIDNAISTISNSTVYDLCFNRDGLSNPTYSIDDPQGMCRLIERDPLTGRPARTRTPYSNLGALETSGIDANFNWGAELADIGLTELPGAISLSVSVNYLLSFKAQDFPTQPAQEMRGTASRGGLFDFRTVTTLRYTLGRGNVALNWRFTPSIKNTAYVNDPTTTLRGAVTYSRFSLTGGYNVSENLSISGGIDNLFDIKPRKYGKSPTTTAVGSTLSGAYDTLGRRFYLSIRLDY